MDQEDQSIDTNLTAAVAVPATIGFSSVDLDRELSRLTALGAQLSTAGTEPSKAAVFEAMSTMLEILRALRDISSRPEADVEEIVDAARTAAAVSEAVSTLAVHLSGISVPAVSQSARNKPPPSGPIIVAKSVTMNPERSSA